MRSCAALCFLLIGLTAVVSAQDTVRVKTGWNIIGSVKAGAIPDVLTTDPPGIITTAFFGYDPGAGYQSTDTLGKGLGYWVKVSEDGVIVFNADNSIAGLCGTKRVTYAGTTYHTVKIGDQCWLEENLEVGTMVTGVTEQTDNALLEKYCYFDSPPACAQYGGFYQWDEAMQYTTTPGAQGICPPGWHIPTYAEFQTLSSTVGGDGNALKAIGQGTGGGADTNTSGFTALLAGGRTLSTFFYAPGLFTYFWSSAEFDATDANLLHMVGNASNILLYEDSKDYGFSVRCIED